MNHGPCNLATSIMIEERNNFNWSDALWRSRSLELGVRDKMELTKIESIPVRPDRSTVSNWTHRLFKFTLHRLSSLCRLRVWSIKKFVYGEPLLHIIHEFSSEEREREREASAVLLMVVCWFLADAHKSRISKFRFSGCGTALVFPKELQVQARVYQLHIVSHMIEIFQKKNVTKSERPSAKPNAQWKPCSSYRTLSDTIAALTKQATIYSGQGDQFKVLKKL